MNSTKATSIDEYLKQFEGDIRLRLDAIRVLIKNLYPDAEESIRYNMPAFKLGKQHVYFAAYKKHIGMYPIYNLPNLKPELEMYKGKGTKDAIHFPHNQPLPMKLIELIIKEKASQH